MPRHFVGVIEVARRDFEHFVAVGPQLFADFAISLSRLGIAVDVLAQPVEVDARARFVGFILSVIAVRSRGAKRSPEIDFFLPFGFGETCAPEHVSERLFSHVHR